MMKATLDHVKLITLLEKILTSLLSFFFSAFKMIEGSHAVGQKLVYLLGNIVSLALALYKCHSMGLLPSHTSDWLAFVEPQMRVEYSGGGMSLV